jgi:drug/metabolite transporter (DMT)-like permease
VSTLVSQYSTSATARGIVFAVMACAGFSTLDATSQLIGLAAPIFMVQWVRYSMQVAVATSLLAASGSLKNLRITKPAWHVSRGLLMVASTVIAFTSLRSVPVAEFTAIIMLSPLVNTLASSRLLGERVSGMRWLLAAGGFIGVLVIVRPFSHTFEPAILWVLLLVVVGTAFQLLTSVMMRTENSEETYLSSGVVGWLVATAILPFIWQALPLKIWGLILLVAAASCFGHYMLMLALKHAPSSVVSPYLYAQLPFAVILGWLVLGNVPDGWSWLGMLLILVFGLANTLLSLKESKEAVTENPS